MAPAQTALPGPASTGTDSPVRLAMSRLASPSSTMPSAGSRSPARSSMRSPGASAAVGTTSWPSPTSRRTAVRDSRRSARMASREPIRLRSSSTCAAVITIGRIAAVARSPLAQAPTSASATSRSVTPCRLGWRRLCQAATSTGTLTISAAIPDAMSATAAPPGTSQRQSRAIPSRPVASIDTPSRAASTSRSARPSRLPAGSRSAEGAAAAGRDKPAADGSAVALTGRCRGRAAARGRRRGRPW